MYKHLFKRLLDIVLAFLGIVVLAIPMLIASIIIFADDPGSIIFTQKRVGIKKQGELTYFSLLKFRTMKMSTPHDIPTHLMNDPEEYITKVGGILRKTSIDELPQLFNILSGKMSIVGPRPALWNQYDLIAERDKYNANDVTPGLTGWAQVNGRDELEIADKAKLDGEYAGHVTFKMDWTCFWMTVFAVMKHKGVVEGGTGALAKESEKSEAQLLTSSDKLR